MSTIYISLAWMDNYQDMIEQKKRRLLPNAGTCTVCIIMNGVRRRRDLIFARLKIKSIERFSIEFRLMYVRKYGTPHRRTDDTGASKPCVFVCVLCFYYIYILPSHLNVVGLK